jgi:4-hydroxybenzoate polyprenyltransferase
VPEGQVADAPRGNWVDRYAPLRARPYLRLSRADRPIGTWLLFAPCLWGGGLAGMGDGLGAWDAWIILSCAGGAFLMRGAGCTWNDLADVEIDAAVARTASRPLPSGQVTKRAALVWMVAQALISALVLFSYNWLAVGLGIASLALVAVYPFAKRFTWWPQVFLGLAFNWGALLAYAAHAGAVSGAAVVLYAAGIMWTLFYDTIYAHQDREDDALIGVKSTARLFGAASRRWLWGFAIAATGLAGMAVWLAGADLAGAGLVGAHGAGLVAAWLGVAGFGLHMAWQMRGLNLDDPASCLHMFRSNRDTGLILGLFFAVAAWL